MTYQYLSFVDIGTSAIRSMCCLSANLITSIAPFLRLASAPPHCPGVTHTQAPKSTPEQLRHRRSGRDVMTPNALQPSCLCFCFSSDGPVFLPSLTSPDCRFPLTAALLASVYGDQYARVAGDTSYFVHCPEDVRCVARMTKKAGLVMNRPPASALITTLNDVREAALQKSGYSPVT